MANRVDTLVQAEQATRSDPLGNPPVAEPALDQLRTRDHTPLPLGKPSQEG